MTRSPLYGHRPYPVPAGKAFAYQQPVVPSLAGAVPIYRPAYESGDLVQCVGRWRTIAVVRAPAEHDVTLKVRAVKSDSYGYFHEEGPTIPAGETRYVGPFHPDKQHDAHDRVLIQYDDPEGVEIASVALPGR